MITGYVILGAILLAIGASAIKWLPSFAQHIRIGLQLAAGSGELRLPRRARVIPFRVSRTASR
jgi:hypothetical protein